MREQTYKTIVAYYNGKPTIPMITNGKAPWSYKRVCVGDFLSCLDAKDELAARHGHQCAFVQQINPVLDPTEV